MVEVVVVGGGQAGLAASWHLARRGIEHVVLERGRVAETWRAERWDSFALNTPDWMNRLPGDEADPEPRDGFLTRDAWAARLETYATHHALPVRVGRTVTGVDPGRAPGTFLVTHTGPDRDLETIEARHVVLACGGQRAPNRPALADALPSDVVQIHSRDYRSPDALGDGAVLVVGSAQSGVQIAEDLVLGGRTTYLATSAVGRLRRRYRGRDTLDHLVRNGFYDATPEQLPDRSMMTMPIPQISGVGPLGHTVSLQWLAGIGVRLVGRPTAVDGGRVTFDDSVGANIAAGDRMSAMFRELIDRGIDRLGEVAPPAEPDPADEPHPDPMSVHGPAWIDVDDAGIITVIWATGYAADFGFVHLPVLTDAGIPIHDRGAAPVPGIHFLGLRWQTKRKSALIAASDEEGGQLAERIATRLAGV